MPKRAPKSLPLVSRKKLIACMTAIGLLGKCPIDFFKSVDSSGSDGKIFLDRNKIIEILIEKSKFLIFSPIGHDLYQSISDDSNFNRKLHYVMMDNFTHYRELAKFSLNNGKFPKDELFNKLKSELINKGKDLPVPTFNSLLTMATITGLVENKKGTIKLKFIGEYSFKDRIELIDRFIKEFIKDESFTGYYKRETEHFIEYLDNKIDNSIEFSKELLFHTIYENRKKFKVKFEMGVGSTLIKGEHGMSNFEDRIT